MFPRCIMMDQGTFQEGRLLVMVMMCAQAQTLLSFLDCTHPLLYLISSSAYCTLSSQAGLSVHLMILIVSEGE